MKRGLFSELKRRNVHRAAILYVGAVWALAQGIAAVGPAVGITASGTRYFLVAATVGFPFWLAIAWFYELTPKGLRRERDVAASESITRQTGRKLDLAIIGVLSVAVVLLLTNTFVWHEKADLAGDAGGEGASPGFARSIAVLPFANLSSDKEQDYFSEGISEDLLNLLTRIPQLRVTARSSSFAVQRAGLAMPNIARKLRVAHVLEGSVQKSGDEVRITAWLVDTRSDTQVWSRSYDRKLTDLFAIQDSIADDVVRSLRVKLLGAEPTARATDPRAYALYLQGRELGRRFMPTTFRQSDSLFRRALAIDPRYLPAWNGLAINANNEPLVGVLSSEEGSNRARRYAERALAIDPDDAPAHAALGLVAMYGDNDLAEAAREFQRVLTLEPAELGVLSNAATLLKNLGRLDEAVTLGEALVHRDPVNVTALRNLGISQLWAGRYDAAITSFHAALRLSPGQSEAHYMLGRALLMQGDAKAGLAQIQEEPGAAWRMVGLPLAYCALGRKSEADHALAALIARHAKDAAYNIAGDYAFCGDADEAFEWLDRAVRSNDPGLGEIVPDDLFNKIRSDPRWLPFLRRLGKAPDQLAKIHFEITLPSGA